MHPAVLMFVSVRHVEARVLAAIADAGFADLTLAQGRLMARIPGAGIRLTDLAASAQVTKQTAGALVDQLERASYVDRSPDPGDARARLIGLGERGLAAQRVARREERRILREWTAHLGSDRMAALTDALTALREITDPYAD